MLGISRAAELMLSGKTIIVDDAARIGLVSRVFARQEVHPAARAFAADIAENCAPVSVAISKPLLRESLRPTGDEMAAKEEPLSSLGHRSSPIPPRESRRFSKNALRSKSKDPLRTFQSGQSSVLEGHGAGVP